MIRYLLAILLLPIFTACAAQYRVVPLCNAAVALDDSTAKAVIGVDIPANTVRILYTLTIAADHMPDSAGLAGQAAALLPDKLDFLELAAIAGKIKSPASAGKLHLYIYDGKRCVRKFARGRKRCIAMSENEATPGGTFAIPWQSSLFSKSYYFCLLNPDRSKPVTFHVEAVALQAY